MKKILLEGKDGSLKRIVVWRIDVTVSGKIVASYYDTEDRSNDSCFEIISTDDLSAKEIPHSFWDTRDSVYQLFDRDFSNKIISLLPQKMSYEAIESLDLNTKEEIKEAKEVEAKEEVLNQENEDIVESEEELVLEPIDEVTEEEEEEDFLTKKLGNMMNKTRTTKHDVIMLMYNDTSNKTGPARLPFSLVPFSQAIEEGNVNTYYSYYVSKNDLNYIVAELHKRYGNTLKATTLPHSTTIKLPSGTVYNIDFSACSDYRTYSYAFCSERIAVDKSTSPNLSAHDCLTVAMHNKMPFTLYYNAGAYKVSNMPSSEIEKVHTK